MQGDDRPLVLHVMYRFDVGGLENGIVNLINHMPADAYRHAVLALTEVTDFRQRIQRNDVEFVSLRKPPGHGVWQYPKLFRLIRKLRPAIVHSRNLAALEVQVPAWAAGVPVRIHGEHGRDVGDLDGSNVTYQRVRRFYRPFVHHYMALSRDLADYLVDKVQVPPSKINQVYNGVDTDRFCPAPHGQQVIAGCPFNPAEHFIVGTVGRMQPVKDQIMLANAFVQAIVLDPKLRLRMRLVMVGEGPLRAQAQAMLDTAGLGALAWLPGERSDVADIMRGMHVFALPSLAEGISNTILEAMASAVPVVATAVGGNADLVLQGQTGYIVPSAHPQAMALRLVELASSPARAHAMGQAGRQRVQATFSLQAMVSTYQRVYDQQLRLSDSIRSTPKNQ
ncbi:MAG: TIGR03088 family PEP-CTERM/XrtA system glycosyltransferase [Rhodoferax sp.]|uniref:TIGR03088 family PEP-CTERM/XrtA system glycosyltransferase n=1 Tax=Rhodoferax sp. TaxID=50421 RepID=UPI002718341E|nr:TIGR03088 family PEP-CTERM/XrtA system glycosyltransferase [Rhodoferax sp.]MDO8450858.1 TIGR03088 family PEP-CTERM/XrtA system glycosyltransferase [Rhodoferax sp.]